MSEMLQLQYVRWALGLWGNTSPRLDTLAEVGELPLTNYAAQSRVKYFELTRSRSARLCKSCRFLGPGPIESVRLPAG